MYGNGRPTISNKKMVRLCLALTMLAWATQVLFKQWGYGAEMPAARPAAPAAVGGAVATNAPAVAGVSDDAGTNGVVGPAGPAGAFDGDAARPAGRTPTAAERFLAAQTGMPAQTGTPATPASAVVAAGAAEPTPPAAPAERFITARPPSAGVGAALELRSEATVVGTEVRLKQVARWSARDAEFFRSVGDLVLARLDARTPYKVVALAEVRRALADAGVNVARVRFAGPTGCAVNRADAKPDPESALANWIAAKEKGTLVAEANRAGGEGAPVPAPLPVAGATRTANPQARTASAIQSAAAPASVPLVDAKGQAGTAVDMGAVRSLRELLTDDLSVRLRVPVEQLQLTFNPKDERVLNLCEPQFKFNLDGQSVRNLGNVTWEVTIVSAGTSQKVSVTGVARAWQQQTVVNRPVAYRGVIRTEDVAETRALTDRLPDEPLLTAGQAVGQQAGRDLKPGTVLTGRMVEAVPLCKGGDLVTINLAQGGVRVTSVARAKEGGSFGQRIQVRNEATNETYSVVLTGPQEATLGEPAAR